MRIEISVVVRFCLKMANFETVSNADTVNSVNRGSFWSDEEVHLLVSIWADENELKCPCPLA